MYFCKSSTKTANRKNKKKQIKIFLKKIAPSLFKYCAFNYSFSFTNATKHLDFKILLFVSLSYNKNYMRKLVNVPLEPTGRCLKLNENRLKIFFGGIFRDWVYLFLKCLEAIHEVIEE